VALDPRQIQVDRPISILEERAAERLYEEEREKVTFGQAVDAAFAEENTMSWIFNGLESHEPSEDFRLTPELIEKYTEGIPEDRRDYVADAVSLPHLQKMHDRAKESIKNQETLAKYGWGGVGLQIAAATLDVPAIAATIATEGIAAPMIWGGKATRLGRVFRNATASAASAAAIESYLVSQNNMKDPYDILYAAGGGFLLGGAVSAGVSIFGKESAERYKRSAINTMRYAEEGQAADVNQAMIDRGIDTGVGAAENPTSRPVQEMDIRRGNQERIDDADAEPFAAFGKLRFDMIGQLKSSTLGISRRIAGILGEDAVEPGEITADLIKTVGTKVMSNKFYVKYDDAYDSWATANGVSYGGRKLESRRGEFGKLVADEIESPGTSTDANVTAAARNTSLLFKDMLQEAKRAGVKGFDDIPEDLTYFTHLWDGHRFLKAEEDFGTQRVQLLLKNSLLSANRGMDDDIAEAIARGMYGKIVKNEIGMDAGLARIFSTSNKEALRDILLEEELLDEARVDRLLSQLDMDREGVPARAKRRLKFDMSASDEFNGKTLHIKDLMERDTEAVVNSYINSMQGKVALAKKGIFSDGDFEAIKKDILEEGKKLGVAGRKQADKDIEKLDVLYALISGRTSPLIGDPSSTGNRVIRLLMDYNFIRVMNQVGFAQISELGNAVSIDGTTALMRVMPDFRAMIRRTANGELEDLVARDIEAFVGSGVDRKIQQAMNKYSVEDMYGLGKGDFIDKAIGGMNKLKRLTADLSGLAPITVALERAAAKVAVQSFVDIASGIPKRRMKKLGNTTLEQDVAARLKSFGLDEEMWPRVVQQIQQHAVTNPSMFLRSRKVKAINMTEWDDIEARDAFAYAVARWTRQSIQQNDVGNLNIHMTSTMGKIFTQFRAFMLVSHSKQFLHNIKRNDFAAYQAMMWSTFYGGLAYTAQMHVNALGREDKAEFLKERLSVEEIGKNAFARSSWAALFPSAADTLAWATGYEPMFSYKRSTGLATGFLSGAPIVNQLDTMGKVIQGGARSILNPDYQWSRGQQRALNSLLPFQNAIGIKNILNQMVEGLPEQAKIE
jgi:L-rhamnose mutarotase